MTTAAGEARRRRRYFACRSCGPGAHPFDDWLGLQGSLSRRARRPAAAAAAGWPFGRASALLREFCGLRLPDDAIRTHSPEAARPVREWQRQTPALRDRFQQAAGPVAFSTDGTGAQRSRVPGLLDSLGPHQGHTAYRERLANGRPIGGGLIEGACKTAAGRRLTQAGARRRVRQAGRMTALGGVLYGEHGDAYWDSKNH